MVLEGVHCVPRREKNRLCMGQGILGYVGIVCTGHRENSIQVSWEGR